MPSVKPPVLVRLPGGIQLNHVLALPAAAIAIGASRTSGYEEMAVARSGDGSAASVGGEGRVRKRDWRKGRRPGEDLAKRRIAALLQGVVISGQLKATPRGSVG